MTRRLIPFIDNPRGGYQMILCAFRVYPRPGQRGDTHGFRCALEP
jgi:hypothetical protein